MAYTLRGRLESRLAAALAPLVAACVVALALEAWWPVELAALMLAAGLALDGTAYHRLVAYQPGWAALPLGLLELGVVMGLARLLDVGAPLWAALAFFAGSWLLAQLLGHAVLPLARLTYGEDGGELGRAGPGLAGAALVVLGAALAVAWATQPPLVRLEAGVHDGPLVLDRSQRLVGEPGAVVRGGILVTANDVTVRDVTVVGGEHGIEVDGAERVLLEDVRVVGATLDGINVRRSTVTIRDCAVRGPTGSHAQGIDISFGFDLAPSVVERCTVSGGMEGIVTHFARVLVRDNRVSGTSLRGITLTEMSMADVEENEVERALGVGIFCGDYSRCRIEDNSVAGTMPDLQSGDKTRMGFGIVAHYGADAEIDDNRLHGNARRIGSFLRARISSD
ncbi:MAG TPA: right-handed parallel beta-helix repeat-containing protein [Gaiellaceae bacterium]|nr:right-handed parallel beta-helix repeat-containing protein [Gaiellaceae bacterium]